MAIRKRTRPKPPQFQKHLLGMLTLAILMAITVSSVKLFSACAMITGQQLSAATTAALFCILGAGTHLSTRSLGTTCRIVAFSLVYGLKFVSGLAHSIQAHAQSVHSIMLEYDRLATIHSSTGSIPIGTSAAGFDLTDAIIFVVGVHPPTIVASVLVSLFFFMLSDILAITLEYVHSKLDD